MAATHLATICDAKLVLQLKAILAVREHPVERVGEILKVSPRSIFRWVHRLQEGGVAGLKDRPKGHRRSKLDDAQQTEVERWVTEGKTPAGAAVLWTVEKLRRAVLAEFGVTITKTPLWRMLRLRNLAPRRPRPTHAKADPAAQAAFKKTPKTARSR